MTVGVPEVAVGQIRLSQQQFLYGVLDWVIWRGNSAGVADEIAHGQTSTSAVTQAVGISLLIVAAQLYGVVALHPCEMLGPIPGLVGAGGNGITLYAANVAAVPQGLHVDVGHAEVRR